MDVVRSPVDAVSFGADGLQALVDVLVERGYEVLGPTVRDGVIAVGPLASIDQLPVGWGDDQSPGRYRLVPRDDGARFGWAVGPQTWKPVIHPSRAKALTMTQQRPVDAVNVQVHRPTTDRPAAFVGVRPCELAAIDRLDHVLLADARPEPIYAARRDGAFVVAVECGAPAATCFCPSTNTGPGLDDDAPAHDIALTEIPAAADGDGPDRRPRSSGDAVDRPADSGPRYVARPASAAGRSVLDDVADRAQVDPAAPADLLAAAAVTDAATTTIRRTLDTDGLRDRMLASLEHDRWAEIAERCLACGNCTAVCPTCFCTATEDTIDLTGDVTERWRRWDTCFGLEFSRVGPEPVRSSVASRYRQWLVHKLGTWHDQFGESGCVGCGRCITWCPVGIDLTEEVPVLTGAANRVTAGVAP